MMIEQPKVSKLEIVAKWLKTVNVFDSIKRFYGGLIDLIGFIIGQTSDQGADIVIRALPLVSPAPNAISMYYVSQTVLGFNQWQALTFAACIEFILFGLFEVTLIMFDDYQAEPSRYKWPLTASLVVSLAALVLIIFIVATLETKHPILAWLPLLSAAGATALALKRWHVRNHVMEKSQVTKSVKPGKTVAKAPVVVVEESQPIMPEESGQIDVIAEIAVDPIERMRAGKARKIAMRHDMILQHLRDEELSVGDLAERLGFTEKTIEKDLDALQAAGHSMSINGVVKLER